MLKEGIDYKLVDGHLVIKDGVIEIGEEAFYNSELKSISIPNSVKTIGAGAFIFCKLESVSIPNSVTTVGKIAFYHNQLKKVEIPDSVIKIENGAFSDNQLESVKIPSSVKTIGNFAFFHNQLTKVEIPDSITKIENDTFSDNQLASVIIPSSVTTIGANAFSGNQLESVIIPNSVTIIGDYAFSNNQLASVTISSSVTTIGANAFSDNKLASVTIPSSVTTIGANAFSNNKLASVTIPSSVITIGANAFSNNILTNIEIPSSVTTIGANAFSNNILTNIEIPSSVTAIGANAFSNNILTNIEIPSSVTTIGKFAFNNNQLTTVTIPDSVIVIDSGAFSNNKLKSVTIPNNITKMGEDSFDKSVIITYKGRIYEPSFWNKYGIQNIIKINTILALFPNLDLEKFSDIFSNSHLLESMPLDNDAIKSLVINKSLFDKTLENILTNNKSDYSKIKDKEEYADFYKLFYTLGFFNTCKETQDKIVLVINEMCRKYTIDNIHQMFTSVQLKKFYPNFAETVLNDYNNIYLWTIISRYYNEFPVMSKIIEKSKKEEIGKLNASIRTKKANNEDVSLLEHEYEIKKANIKLISVEDVIDYIKDHALSIREGNEELTNIVQILSSGVTQEQFNAIQDIYEEAKTMPNNFSNPMDQKQESYHYYWSSGNNPVNIILGYICDCCAKYAGAGQDIMVQSMINPNVKNLIIYDGMRNIIGKSTAFYNAEKQYILFNNIEISQSFLTRKSTKEEDKESVLDAILRGIYDQVREMKLKGLNINEVRIGMLKNDLENVIKKRKIPIEHTNLLPNYNYNNYSGDANNSEAGQAVIEMKSKV